MSRAPLSEARPPSRSPSVAFRALVLLATLAAAAVPANASAEEGVSAERPAVTRLMALSRLDATVGEFAATARDGLVKRFRARSGEGTERATRLALVERAATRGFAPGRMRALVATHLAAALGRRDVERLLAHHGSPLGQRLVEAERTRRATEEPEAFARFAAGFGDGTDDAERLALLERLVVEGGVAERLARLTVELRVVSLHGMSGLVDDPDAGARWLAREVPKILATREGLERSLRGRLPMMLAYTYAELPTADLRDLLEHALEPASLRMARGLFGGLREGFVAATSEFGTRFGAALEFAEASEEI